MKVNILAPSVAPMLISTAAPASTFLKMTNMTVAMTVATVVVKAETKARMAIGRVSSREYIDKGVRKMLTKAVQAPVKNRPNIQWETTRTSVREETMLAGSATIIHSQSGGLFIGLELKFILVAPASSSSKMISTGLNQYSVLGFIQPVIPCP